MSDAVISVENLSKSYLIGHDGPRESYHSLRDTLVRHGRNYVRKAIDMARGRQIIQGDSVEEFWALKDVSFEVKRGEVLGIIGRNGAGKSTLLKILSRITEPTSGRVVLNGRVASLLEVGTGFHPELSGRENIFLNGAILGMSKVEIRKKFDEIVDFAGIEKFLDTPVKRYSSGMYVRLAFAVAAHLEPEILIIDEVLAVGDAEFQKKCLGKMQEVAKGGRTVLFVSHNLAAVSKLCSRAIWLAQGSVMSNGIPLDIIEQYEIQAEPVDGVDWKSYQDENIGMTPVGEAGVIRSGSPVKLKVDIQINGSARVTGLAMVISNRSGIRVAVLDFRNSIGNISATASSGFSIDVEIRTLPFVEGTYFIDWFIETHLFTQDVPTCWRMEVMPCENTIKSGAYDARYRGVVEIETRSAIRIS